MTTPSSASSRRPDSNESLNALRWRIGNCHNTLERLRDSQRRIQTMGDSAMKNYLLSLNGDSLKMVERSLAALERVLELEEQKAGRAAP